MSFTTFFVCSKDDLDSKDKVEKIFYDSTGEFHEKREKGFDKGLYTGLFFWE